MQEASKNAQNEESRLIKSQILNKRRADKNLKNIQGSIGVKFQ